MSTPRKRGRPPSPEPKTMQFIFRMTPQLRKELNELCRLGGRPLSHQINHMLAIAAQTIELCGGNDNLKHIEDTLEKAKKALNRSN